MNLYAREVEVEEEEEKGDNEAWIVCSYAVSRALLCCLYDRAYPSRNWLHGKQRIRQFITSLQSHGEPLRNNCKKERASSKWVQGIQDGGARIKLMQVPYFSLHFSSLSII
eukprot:Gb_30827 [translate_table: standard]